jgi:hypothetical protein
VKKLILLFALCASFYFTQSHGDSAVCTPVPPNNSVLIGATGCKVVNGMPQMSVTVIVPTVGTNTNVYRIVQNLTATSVGDAVMVIDGTVPTGTVCDSSEQIVLKGVIYYRVDRTLVTFTGNNQPPTAWALCN